MANNVKISNKLSTDQGTATIALLAGGSVEIYDSTGTGQPATADTAPSTQLLLATIPLPASGSWTNTNTTGVKSVVATTATSMTATVAAAATATGKTATWYRAKTSGGVVIATGTVGGTSGGPFDLTLTTSGALLVEGATVTVSSFSHTIPQ